MTEPSASPLRGWRTGVHPGSAGMRIRSMERVHLQLGDALRLEMADVSTDTEVVHLQYYIATALGPWALWLSGATADVAESEAWLRELTPPFAEEAQP